MDRITSTTGGSTAALLPGGLDEYFLRTDSNGESVPLTDALGSIIAMTGASGTMNTTYWYSPYGLTTIAGVASGNSTQYAGRENDQTSLYYCRARYYSPEIGRFISQDPSGLAAGLNLYEYAGDDPVNFDDPLGLNSRPSGPAGGGFPPVCTFLVCMTFGGNPAPTPPNNPGPANPSDNPNPCPPSSDPPTTAIGALATDFHEVAGPVDISEANGFMFFISGGLVVAGTSVLVGGCGDLGADVVTCLPSLALAGEAYLGAAAAATDGIYTFQTATLPAWDKWSCGD